MSKQLQRLIAELKAQREISAVFERGQQNACDGEDAARRECTAWKEFAASLEVRLKVAIERAEAAFKARNKVLDDLDALRHQNEEWRKRAEVAEAKLALADFGATRFADATVREEKMVAARDALAEMLVKEQIAHQTERTMHAAWRKRAEEAEKSLAD